MSSISDASDIMPQILPEIGTASGKLVLRLRLLEAGSFEIEADIIAGKTEGVGRMFAVVEDKRLLGLETTYLGDRKHGPIVAYYPGEGVMYEGFFDMDRKTGDWVLNYRNGGRAVSAGFRDDLFDGPVQVFDAAGQEIANGVYAAGNPVDGTFIEDPWAIGQSLIAEYGDYFTTQHFRCTSGVMSEAKEIQILKKMKKAAPKSDSAGLLKGLLKGTGQK